MNVASTTQRKFNTADEEGRKKLCGSIWYQEKPMDTNRVSVLVARTFTQKFSFALQWCLI
jgi:hypothetical protein